jgi:hypothetical protein
LLVKIIFFFSFFSLFTPTFKKSSQHLEVEQYQKQQISPAKEALLENNQRKDDPVYTRVSGHKSFGLQQA